MDARRGPFDDFAIATAVLTRLPVGTAATEDGTIAAAGWAFPLVGAGVGAVAAIGFLLAELLGLGPAPAALLAVLAAVAVIGAFHEDGLADTADGLLGGHDRQQRREIMHDSRQGTYGVLAIVLSIGLRAAALGTIGGALYSGLAPPPAHRLLPGAP